MTDAYETMTAAFSPAAYEKWVGSAKEQFEKMAQNPLKGYEDFARFSKENMDAYVAAGQIAAKGFESLGKAWVAFTQEAMEASAQTARALLGAKTLREAVDLNSDFAKTTFDKFVAESTKMSEIGVKVANEALEPINARVNQAVEKLFKTAAA